MSTLIASATEFVSAQAETANTITSSMFRDYVEFAKGIISELPSTSSRFDKISAIQEAIYNNDVHASVEALINAGGHQFVARFVSVQLTPIIMSTIDADELKNTAVADSQQIQAASVKTLDVQSNMQPQAKEQGPPTVKKLNWADMNDDDDNIPTELLASMSSPKKEVETEKKVADSDSTKKVAWKPVEQPKRMNWSEMTEQEEALALVEDAEKAAAAVDRSEKLAGLTLAMRMRVIQLAEETGDEISKIIDSEKKKVDDAAKANRLAMKTAAAAAAAAKKKAKDDYKKFHVVIPAKPIKANKEDVTAGFQTVSKKKPVKKASVMSSINAHEEKARTVTSAGFFFCGGIIPEHEDWFLWDYNINEQGLAEPIGWYRIGDNRFKINKASQFVHTRHPDGTWTHDEDVVDANGHHSYIRVSNDYFRWVITPPNLRRGACPSE